MGSQNKSEEFNVDCKAECGQRNLEGLRIARNKQVKQEAKLSLC